MNGKSLLKEKIEKVFQGWLFPLVNLENTLLLFATFIFHYYYFGEEHVIADFLAVAGGYLVAIYIYGAIILLASLIKTPADWQEFMAFMVFLGSTLIGITYTSFFWVSTAMPSWQELLAELYYVLQSILALIQVILLLTQEKGKRLTVAPRLENVPGLPKSMAILIYVVGMTLLLDNVFSIAPDLVTAQVNLFGAFLLEGLTRIRMAAHRSL